MSSKTHEKTGDKPAEGATTGSPLQRALADAPKDAQQEGQKPENEAPRKLTEAELSALPEYVQDAARRQGGAVPMAAPKGGEGELGAAKQPLDEAYPELQPPVAPTEYRAAPTAPSARAQREKWGERPTADDVEGAGKVVRVRSVDPNSAGFYVGGVRVSRDTTEVAVDEVRARSDAHLAALLTDPRIELQLKK